MNFWEHLAWYFAEQGIPSGSDIQSCVLEFILTFLLMTVILTSIQRKDRSLIGPALAIGATVGLEALFAGPICGASMNPARSLSPAIIAGYYQSLWIYILGPVSGAIAGSFVFAIFKEDYVEMDQTTNNFVNSSFINGQGDKIF